MRLPIPVFYLASVLPLAAQQAPSWGVGLSRIEPERAYSPGTGVDLSWEFYNRRWIKWRMRLDYGSIGEGAGQVKSEVYPSSGTATFWNQAQLLALTCEWSIPVMRHYGPYFLLGVGIDHNRVRNRSRQAWGAMREETSICSGPTVTVGAGFLISDRVELEYRVSLRSGPDDKDWGTNSMLTEVGAGLLYTASLGVRYRF